MNKAYTYELNLLGGVLSMALKLSLRLSMSAYLEQIARYAKHVKSKSHCYDVGENMKEPITSLGLY